MASWRSRSNGREDNEKQVEGAGEAAAAAAVAVARRSASGHELLFVVGRHLDAVLTVQLGTHRLDDLLLGLLELLAEDLLELLLQPIEVAGLALLGVGHLLGLGLLLVLLAHLLELVGDAAGRLDLGRACSSTTGGSARASAGSRDTRPRGSLSADIGVCRLCGFGASLVSPSRVSE